MKLKYHNQIPILSYYANSSFPQSLILDGSQMMKRSSLTPAEASQSFRGDHINELGPHSQYQWSTCQPYAHCTVHILLSDSQPTNVLLVFH